MRQKQTQQRVMRWKKELLQMSKDRVKAGQCVVRAVTAQHSPRAGSLQLLPLQLLHMCQPRRAQAKGVGRQGERVGGLPCAPSLPLGQV